MKEAGGKHSKEEYDNRIMGANATIMGAKKEKKQQKKDRFLEKRLIKKAKNSRFELLF